MVGDPSGKSKERNLLTRDEIEKNIAGQKAQLERFLNFNQGESGAEMVDNYDWFKDFNFLDFIRDVGKHITVNYMMAKESVKTRLETGISFTEFSYQLIQGYDFYWLNQNKKCVVQMGGADQWGNIVTGTELIRRMGGGEAFAVTTPLIKKADGTKFGKTESGNVWLDKERTTPYQFYQFWYNSSDEDAKNYIKIFTLKPKEEIVELIQAHDQDPGQRILQKELAKDITIRVHGEEDFDAAIEASNILYGKATGEALKRISEQDMLTIFSGVPKADLALNDLKAGIPVIELFVDKTGFLPSNKEARRALKENSMSLNKEKVQGEITVSESDLLNNKYLLLQRGKKKYFLVTVV
jgi:tyrosyl-tRNA synthetase